MINTRNISLFSPISPAVRQRLPFAVRAGICCGLPVLAGYFAGDIHSGLLATIGSFTALYGSDRPYINRGWHLAVVAVLMAAVVMLGMVTGDSPWAAVLIVAAISTLATFVCNALRVGPPGAYMFALACASGTGMSPGSPDPWQSGLWVLCGGGVSWLAHMSGALFHRYQPEQRAVFKAAVAVSQFVAHRDARQRDRLRQSASQGIDSAWLTLLNWQSEKSRQSAYIQYLLWLTQQLSPIIARAEMAFATNNMVDPALSLRAKQIADDATAKKIPEQPVRSTILQPEVASAWYMCQENLTFWSAPFQLALRVCLATLIAGSAGALLGLNHAYWGMAAVVVVLNQPYGWPGTTRRATYRIAGTLAGILLAWGVLSLHPQGLWIALTVGILQFIIEIWVVVQYAIAAIFITTNALVIAAGGRGVPDLSGLLGARALDTVIGCGVAIIVFVLMLPRTAFYQIRVEMRATLAAAGRLSAGLAHDSHLSSSVLSHRISLRRHLLALQQSADDDIDAARLNHPKIAPLLNALRATKMLSWKLLTAASYTTEPHTPADHEAPLNGAQYQQIAGWLAELRQSDHPSTPRVRRVTIGFLQQEMDTLEQCYRQVVS